MQCPRCRRALASRTLGTLDADVCAECGGMLLDRGELNRIAEPTGGDLEYSTLHDESFDHDDAYGSTSCPRCDNRRMDKVEFNIHTAIILDHCAGCGAFWLDGRELDRINDEVRRLNEESKDAGTPPMMWFAQFIWSLPR